MRINFILILIASVSQVISDSLNCDFNSNDCTWYPPQTTLITWRWTGQMKDDVHGGYLEVPTESPSIGQYLSSSSSTSHNTNLISGSIRNLWYIPRSGCFSFSYRFYFLDSGWLNLTLWPISGDPVLLHSIKDGRSLDWSRVSVDIGNSPEFYLEFTFSLELINSNDWIISLDDFTFSKDKQCSDFTLCDFETGSCHWKLTGWQRVTAGQSIPTDHSTLTSSGHFIEPKVFGSKSYVSLTPLPSNTPKSCLAFWTYVDLRREMPQLFIRQTSGDQVKVDLERPTTNYQSWQYHQITVSLKNSISIETFASSSSQLAIDDLILYEKPCSSMGTCDFSYDSCGWFNSGKSLWIRQIGLLPSLASKSIISKEFDSHQWYVISETKGGQAIFESSPMVIETLICFSFSYFFTLTDTKSFNNLVINLNQIDDKIINDRKVIQVDKIQFKSESTINWNHFERTINVQSQGWFTISLISDQENQSTIVLIDDIEIKPEKCSDESPTDQLIVTTIPTPTTTIETDCCILEPCICVNSHVSSADYDLGTTTSSISASTEQSTITTISKSIETTTDQISTALIIDETSTPPGLTTTVISTNFDDLEIKSTTTESISTKNIPTEIDSSILSATTNSYITEFVTNDQTTLITTKNEQFKTPIQTQSTINYNQEISSPPSNEINLTIVDATTTMTSSKFNLMSTFHLDQSTASITITTESITIPTTDLIITLAPEQKSTKNSSNEEKLSIGDLGNNLITIANLIFDERPFIASISGLAGLIILIIGLVVLTFNWKKSSNKPHNQRLIVAAVDMELQTFTFTRQTINSNNQTTNPDTNELDQYKPISKYPRML